MTNYPLRLPDHVMAEAEALAHIEARAARADAGRALEILGRVPERAPMTGDER